MFITVKSQSVIVFSDINECSPNPCQNGATCVDLIGGHRCDCAQGYSGSSCETSNHQTFIVFAVLKFTKKFLFINEMRI